MSLAHLPCSPVNPALVLCVPQCRSISHLLRVIFCLWRRSLIWGANVMRFRDCVDGRNRALYGSRDLHGRRADVMRSSARTEDAIRYCRLEQPLQLGFCRLTLREYRIQPNGLVNGSYRAHSCLCSSADSMTGTADELTDS